MSPDGWAQSESGSGAFSLLGSQAVNVPCCCVMQNETKQHENITMVFYWRLALGQMYKSDIR